MIYSSLVLFSLLAVLQAPVQSSHSTFVLDASKPYAYLAFDHLGHSTSAETAGETNVIWLRIVNNCNVTLSVQTSGTRDGAPGVLYDVIPVSNGGVTSSSGDAIEQTGPAQRSAVPRGFSSEIPSMKRISPGKSLLFSIPEEKVGAKWFLRVKVNLDVSEPTAGLDRSRNLISSLSRFPRTAPSKPRPNNDNKMQN